MAGTAGHSMPFGAELQADGRVRFRLWAPDAQRVDVCLETGDRPERILPCEPLDEGWFALTTGEAAAGTRYRYRIDAESRVPDPASRHQPDGVGGPSEVVDPSRYAWRTGDWRGRSWHEAVLYELHVGAFTPGGTFDAAAERLGHLADLGITAIEVMPVATFAGARGWGYDGVLLYAPHAAYGGPDGFCAFVDAAHAHGIMVLLDVVYNHFGPEGNYLHLYARRFFTERHQTPWGAAINFDGDDSGPVRDFYVHNALYWLEEYRLDGLRLDAVHAIVDDSRPHILEALADAVHAGPGASRPIHLVLENDRNEARYLRAGPQGRPRYAAQWNDDFHHACHTLVTGETDGYYVDYASEPVAHLGRCLREGFAYQGEPSRHRGGATRGEVSRDVPSTAFVAFLQNHDQVGNRAFGERLSELAAPAALRAAASLAMLAPAVPALFMGEEFGCRRPFLYFVDFEGELAAAVRRGRQREFASFERFAAAGESVQIPDPTAEETFRASVLDWSALDEADHAQWLDFYRELLALRRRVVVPRLPAAPRAGGGVFGAGGLDVAWELSGGGRLAVLANLGDEPLRVDAARRRRGAPIHAVPGPALDRLGVLDTASVAELPPWSVLWHLEETR